MLAPYGQVCSARGHARSIASPGRGTLPFRACSTARALIAAAAGGSAAAWALLTMRCAQLRSSAHRTTLSPGSLCWGARVQASLASAVVRSGRSSLDTELFLKKAGLKIVSWHGICVGQCAAVSLVSCGLVSGLNLQIGAWCVLSRVSTAVCGGWTVRGGLCKGGGSSRGGVRIDRQAQREARHDGRRASRHTGFASRRVLPSVSKTVLGRRTTGRTA